MPNTAYTGAYVIANNGNSKHDSSLPGYNHPSITNGNYRPTLDEDPPFHTEVNMNEYSNENGKIKNGIIQTNGVEKTEIISTSLNESGE